MSQLAGKMSSLCVSESRLATQRALDRDGLPSLLFLPPITFDPSSFSQSRGKPEICQSQPIVEIHDAHQPFVQQAVPAAVQLSGVGSDECGGPSHPLIVI